MNERPGAWRALGRGAAVLAFAVLLGGGCGDETDGDTTGAPTTEPSTAGPQPGDVSGVWIDPRDNAHLLLEVIPCVTDPVASAVESDDTVKVTVTATATEPPCEPKPVDLHLDDPLGKRRVVDAEHDIELHVIPAEFLYAEAAPGVAAECTTEAAAAAVEHEVDGGLRSDLLACDSSWMAVDTSTNACPATGDAPAKGCVGNQHVAYFHNDNGNWVVKFFDDCTTGRDQFPDFPLNICRN